MTDRQRRAYDFIVAFNLREGMSPTLREISDHLGFKNHNVVTGYLVRLRSKGLIDWKKGLARSIRLTGQGDKCPCCGKPL